MSIFQMTDMICAPLNKTQTDYRITYSVDRKLNVLENNLIERIKGIFLDAPS